MRCRRAFIGREYRAAPRATSHPAPKRRKKQQTPSRFLARFPLPSPPPRNLAETAAASRVSPTKLKRDRRANEINEIGATRCGAARHCAKMQVGEIRPRLEKKRLITELCGGRLPAPPPLVETSLNYSAYELRDETRPPTRSSPPPSSPRYIRRNIPRFGGRRPGFSTKPRATVRRGYAASVVVVRQQRAERGTGKT